MGAEGGLWPLMAKSEPRDLPARRREALFD